MDSGLQVVRPWHSRMEDVQHFHALAALLLHTLNTYFIYIYELRTKLLVWGNAITKCGGSPIGYQGFGCSGHQHQSRSMQFTLWDDLICYMIEQAKMREFLVTAKQITVKYSNAPSFILVTLPIGTIYYIHTL